MDVHYSSVADALTKCRPDSRSIEEIRISTNLDRENSKRTALVSNGVGPPKRAVNPDGERSGLPDLSSSSVDRWFKGESVPSRFRDVEDLLRNMGAEAPQIHAAERAWAEQTLRRKAPEAFVAFIREPIKLGHRDVPVLAVLSNIMACLDREQRTEVVTLMVRASASLPTQEWIRALRQIARRGMEGKIKIEVDERTPSQRRVDELEEENKALQARIQTLEFHLRRAVKP